MNILNFQPQMNEQQPEQPAEAPVQKSPYYTPKSSDQYSSFINMQNVVNAALKKEMNPNPNDPSEIKAEEGGVRYDV